MTILFRLLVGAITVFGVAQMLSGITVASFYTALIISLLLGLLNITIKPVLLLLTLPINLLTLGLFTLVINAGLLWFLSTIVQGFVITSFGWAFVAALIIAAVNWFIHKII